MYYLIDFENIGETGLRNLTELNPKDTVIIFYGQRKTLSFDTIKILNEKRVHLDFQKAYIGSKNALDFQLSSRVGYLIGKNKSTALRIVSNDKGFDCVVKYWEAQDININRVSPSSESTTS